MAAKGKRPSYRDHAPALKALVPGGKLAADAKVIFLCGPSEYLLNFSIERLRKAATKSGMTAQTLEAASLNEANLSALTSQASLFEPSALYVLRRVEQAKSLGKVLKQIPKADALANHLLLVNQGEGPLAPLRAELDRLGARWVPCFEPWANELPEAVQAIADAHGLKLQADAVQLLIDANGLDLVKHRNEIAKLAFLIPEATTPLTAAMIAPHLGMLREDDAFQLDRLLLQKQGAKAQALASGLLARGEKGLGLVSILAGHCRNSLKIGAALADGKSFDQLAGLVRLPPFIIKNYAQSLGRSMDPRPYTKALQLCQEADRLMKSSPVREELILSQIIETLAGC
jgi:DNA polymerase-3 subunit delta